MILLACKKRLAAQRIKVNFLMEMSTALSDRVVQQPKTNTTVNMTELFATIFHLPHIQERYFSNKATVCFSTDWHYCHSHLIASYSSGYAADHAINGAIGVSHVAAPRWASFRHNLAGPRHQRYPQLFRPASSGPLQRIRLLRPRSSVKSEH